MASPHARMRRALFPTPVVPLPRELARPLLPRLTAKIVHLSSRFLPGAWQPLLIKNGVDAAGDGQARALSDSEARNQEPGENGWGDNIKPDFESKWPWKQIVAEASIIGFMLILFVVTGTRNESNASTGIGNPLFVSCGTSFWNGIIYQPSLSCGIFGEACRPFETSVWFAMQCPPGCGTDASVYASRHVVGGPDNYTADSNVCAAAVHAGVLDDSSGGCFEMRFAGEHNGYNASFANGVQSVAWGWFPRSVAFRAIPGAQDCVSDTYGFDIVYLLGTLLLVVVWRCHPLVYYYFSLQMGMYYVSITSSLSTPFWLQINYTQQLQLTLIPMSMILLRLFNPVLDPRKFPLDVYLFQILPFWAFIHLDWFTQRSGVAFNLSADSPSLNAQSIVVIVLLVAVGIPVFIVQIRALYRAHILPYSLAWLVPFAAYLIAIYVGGHPYVVFHLHHYASGLFFVMFFQGHAWHRANTVMQAVGLALFVQGMTKYGTSPLFDTNDFSGGQGSTGTLSTPSDVPLWTAVADLGNGQVALEWRLPQDLAVNWTCNSNVTALFPSVKLYRERLTSSRRFLFQPDPLPNDVISGDYPYLLGANGIMLNAGFGNQWNGTLPIANSTLVLQVGIQIIFSGSPSTYSNNLVLPYPPPANSSNHFGYYNDSASLCDRLYGIYTTPLNSILSPQDLSWAA